jgi:uncharacterized membrane protein YjjP (DUF1212 family)
MTAIVNEESGAGQAPSTSSVAFVLRLARALHTQGYSADRLEDVLNQVSHRLGLHGQFFSTPTSIFASFGLETSQQTHMIRVEPGQTNLGRLARLDEVTREVVDGRLTPADGAARIDEVLSSPAPYPRWLTVIAFASTSGAASRFLGGGVRETAVAAAVGFVVGLLPPWFGARPERARIFELVAAFVAAFLVTTAGALIGGFSTFTATLGSLLVLIPGFTVTVAMAELARLHLSAGTARLAGAFTVFLAITFGVLVGTQLATALVGAPEAVVLDPLPIWTEWLAVLVVPAAFTVLLQAAPRDVGWILGAGVLSYVSMRAGGYLLGTTLGGFTGALVVGIAANVFQDVRRRPALIPLVPGVLLLVPGSLGYRSLTALADRNVIGGVEAGFNMVITAAGLVAGLLLANVIVVGSSQTARRTRG